MWWGSLPSMAVVWVCLSGIPLWVYATRKFFLTTPYSRNVFTNEEAHLYVRDARISGVQNPYKQVGLENINL